jgi:hypothetical protein
MCCCGKHIVNGEFGYKWQPNDVPGVRESGPPELRDDDELIYDEPGRCCGLDSHSHHYRVVARTGYFELLVRHGGGEDRISLGPKKVLADAFAALDSTERYWILNTIYHAYRDGKRRGAEESDSRWRQAAAEKRIKVRKVRGSATVKVSIETKVLLRA